MGSTCVHSTATASEGGKFNGYGISDLLFLEVFSGSARLSKSVKEAGFQSLPIDKSSSRATQIFTALYDLADPDQLEALLQLMHAERHRIVAVHVAPACGTASKAREKKRTTWAKQGFKIPKPLRSAAQPLGVDNLEGLDKVRTESANLVYAATARIISACIEFDILCSLENPENSLFWFFPDIVDVFRKFPGHSVSFHNCMHGGKRNKLTKWWATKEVFGPLALQCDNSHQHAKWNPIKQGRSLQFPTAEEAAYPHLMCKRIANLLLDYAKNLGATEPDTMSQQIHGTASTAHRWILDMLPKGKQFRPLVSEFQSYVLFLYHPALDPESSLFLQQQLKGARIVHRQIQWGFLRGDAQEFCWEADGRSKTLGGVEQSLEERLDTGIFQAEVCTIGIPREPWDFLSRAVEAGHPRSLAIHLGEEIMDVLRENFELEQYHVMKRRAEFMRKWTNRCKDLEKAEHELHDSLAPHLQQVLRGKRLLIFKEILEDLQYPDKSLIDDICNGFALSGWLPKSHVFPAKLKRPTQSMDSVQNLAKGVNNNICKQVAAVVETELANEVWELTQDEISKGWAWIDASCDSSRKVLAKRFGLRQGAKTRLIDDCTIGGFNATCGSTERLTVHAIDEMAAYIAWCLTNLGDKSMQDVVGRTYDLTSAYKQYGVSCKDRDLLRIAVWDPVESKVRFLGLNALPFGAVGSVSSFLRISMAVWFVGVRGLRLCWSSFFDDYTVLSKRTSSGSASKAVEGLFQLLGIVFAKEGKKAVPWSTKL